MLRVRKNTKKPKKKKVRKACREWGGAYINIIIIITKNIFSVAGPASRYLPVMMQSIP